MTANNNVRSVALTGLAVAFSLFGDMTMYIVLPLHFTALGLTPFEVGIILSANRWVRLVTNHVAEYAVIRKGFLGLMAAALFVAAGLAFVYGLAPGFPLLLLARLAWGMCWSVLRHVGVMNAVSTTTAERVGRMVGLYNSVVRIGFVAGTFLGGLLFDALGYRNAFFLMAAFSLLGLPPAVLGLVGRRFRSGGEASNAPPPARAGTSTYVKGFIVGAVGSGLIMSTLGHVLDLRFGGELAIAGTALGTATVTGFLLGLRHVFQIGGSPLLGALMDRWGVQRSEAVFFVAAAAALAVSRFPMHPAVLFLTVAAFFACETALRIGLTAEAGRRGSRQYALLATAMDAGAATGPLIGWTALAMIVESDVTFVIGAVAYGIGAAVTLFRVGGRKNQRRER